MGFAFLTTGVAFKIAAVPFHYWTPDAYQGSPTPVTGYLSVGPKIGAFALILRLFVEALGPMKADWLPVVDRPRRDDDDPRQPRRADPGQRQADARLQLDRPHRLHARRRSRRSPAASSQGLEGLLFYGAAYSFMNLGAFAVIAALQKRAGRHVEPRRRSPGSAGSEPALGILMALFLLSLTGIPPTAGFFAKALLIRRRGPGRRLGRRSSRCSWSSTPPRPRSTTCGSSSTCSCATRRARPPAAPPRPAAVGRPRGGDGADDRVRALPGADPRDHRRGGEGDRRLGRATGGP